MAGAGRRSRVAEVDWSGWRALLRRGARGLARWQPAHFPVPQQDVLRPVPDDGEHGCIPAGQGEVHRPYRKAVAMPGWAKHWVRLQPWTCLL